MSVAHSIDSQVVPEALKAWIPMLDVWRSGQEGLPQVVRWSKYLKQGEGVRRQDSLQHSYSLAILGRIVLMRLALYRKYDLDLDLVMTALLVHDHGESELKEDTLYIDKTDDGDLNEYLAFVERYRTLDPTTFEWFEQAFLLQFCGRDRESFPAHAQDVIHQLRRSRIAEADIFEAIERLDYLMYAIEQYLNRGNVMILVQVLRHQMTHLDRLASLQRGLHEFWTPSLRTWCTELLAAHEGRWIEQKGQR